MIRESCVQFGGKGKKSERRDSGEEGVDERRGAWWSDDAI